MICTTIQNRTAEEIVQLLSGCEMAEIRLDSCLLDQDGIEECFMSDVPLVATCRISDLMSRNPDLSYDEAVRMSEDLLIKAVIAGARYVDVEIEAPKQMAKRVAVSARKNGAVMIRSFHDFDGTDSYEALKAVFDKCRYCGAEIVKIVTYARSESDVRRVMSLYDIFSHSELIAFCMGDAGRVSRVECLRKGAPFTYAAPDGSDPAAPGQWQMSEMRRAVYRDWKFCGYPVPGLSASREPCTPVDMPCSKSFAQRAVVAAALADGTSRLHRYSACGDNESAVALAAALGAETAMEGDTLVIKGAGIRQASARLSSARQIHVGESGLLTRLMIPVSAALSSEPVTLTGEKTLLERPMKGADAVMSCFGVSLSSQGGGVRVPVTVSGRLTSARTSFSGRDGSQIISGLLMALPLCEGNSVFTVNDPVSIPYMFITVDILKKFGVRISDEILGGSESMLAEGNWDFCSEIVFRARGGQKYSPAEFDLEGDWSTAANFLVAGAVFGRAELSGLDTGSIQADLSIMDILMDAGASISQYDSDSGNISVQRAPLRAFSVDMSDCPDLFPIVSVLAAFCEGTSELKGVERLAHKECDRGKAILETLLKMGVEASVSGGALRISGHSLAGRILGGNLLRGGCYSTFGDHRMAMALSVASLGADSPITVDDSGCVAKSCPGFYGLFERMIG